MRTGHSKGAAFIEFNDEQSASKALKLNGEPVRGI
jgi:RNA recognition motif-containing protein